jgi:hypothetical protein
VDDSGDDPGKIKRFRNGRLHEPPLPIADAPNLAQEPRNNWFHEAAP